MSEHLPTLVDQIRQLVSEEMFLLGQELDDALDARQQHRLSELADTLDEVGDLLTAHRRAGTG